MVGVWRVEGRAWEGGRGHYSNGISKRLNIQHMTVSAL